jgi:hypothetical protein
MKFITYSFYINQFNNIINYIGTVIYLSMIVYINVLDVTDS